jgi:hypothetical protein
MPIELALPIPTQVLPRPDHEEADPEVSQPPVEGADEGATAEAVPAVEGSEESPAGDGGPSPDEPSAAVAEDPGDAPSGGQTEAETEPQPSAV